MIRKILAKTDPVNWFAIFRAYRRAMEMLAIETLRDFYSNAKWYMEVYDKKGELLWKYQDIEPFMSIAMSDDGHYIAAGSETVLVFFDNFQAIEEYALSECGQSIRFFTFSPL
jgi:hypothetical protein